MTRYVVEVIVELSFTGRYCDVPLFIKDSLKEINYLNWRTFNVKEVQE